MLARFFPGTAHLQNLHPLIVHFPIAFLYGAALFYFIAWIARRDSLAWTGMWFLVLGLFSGAAAIATGWWGAEGVMLAVSVKSNVLVYHKWLMVSAAAVAAVLTIWAVIKRPMPSVGKLLFLVGLLVMLVLIAKGADYGGMMVYDYNGGGNACPQPIEYSPNGPQAM